MAPPSKKSKEEREWLRKSRQTFQHKIADDLKVTVKFTKGAKVPAKTSRLLADIFRSTGA